MRLEQSLQNRQNQSLVMTPQLQQAIRLLQMTTLELDDFIEQQIIENPLLQKEEPSFSKGSLSSYDDHSLNWIESTVPTQTTLHQHLIQQLHIATQNQKERSIGEQLIDLINDSGYINENLSEFSLEINEPFQDILNILSLIQTFDPIGVGARTLSECLTIQLKELSLWTDKISPVVDNLFLLQSVSLEKLARICQLSLEECKNALTTIKSLNPKPGLSIASHTIDVRIPDIIVTRQESGIWIGSLNEESIPNVVLDSEYYYDLASRIKKKEETAYLQHHHNQATWLIRSLSQRFRTIQRVADEIIRQQQSFFEDGFESLRPLTLKELAQELKLHESTISRATVGKYMSTPQGIIEFRELLGTGVSKTSLDDISSAHIQHRLKAFIESENPNSTLSDDQLVYLLRKEGLVIARRTVAKYREALEIPSSFERRRLCKLMTF